MSASSAAALFWAGRQGEMCVLLASGEGGLSRWHCRSRGGMLGPQNESRRANRCQTEHWLLQGGPFWAVSEEGVGATETYCYAGQWSAFDLLLKINNKHRKIYPDLQFGRIKGGQKANVKVERGHRAWTQLRIWLSPVSAGSIILVDRPDTLSSNNLPLKNADGVHALQTTVIKRLV